MSTNNKRPRIAFYKLSACSGCQQQLLNAEAELLDIFSETDFVYWYEAQSNNQPGPYDLAFIEGGVSEHDEIEIVKKVREQSKYVVSIGSCAAYGGPQALRNWGKIEDLKEASYPQPEWVKTMDWVSGIDEYIPVDYYVYGCGPNPKHIVEVILAAIQGREPKLPRYSVCVECKSKGNVCILVAGGMNCMGPVTVAGCGAACPSRNRGCYSCFGPMPQANSRAYGQLLETLAHDDDQIARTFRKMNSNSETFKEVSHYYAARH